MNKRLTLLSAVVAAKNLTGSDLTVDELNYEYARGQVELILDTVAGAGDYRDQAFDQIFYLVTGLDHRNVMRYQKELDKS